MAAQTSGKTGAAGTAKKDTVTVRTPTTSVVATGQSAQPTAQPPQPQPQPQRPAPSDRSGIRMNVGRVHTALAFGDSSRSVKAIQYALADRGFDPGTRSGYFDQGTKDAYVGYQRSINETSDGVPTEHSLDYLGFDVI